MTAPAVEWCDGQLIEPAAPISDAEIGRNFDAWLARELGGIEAARGLHGYLSRRDVAGGETLYKAGARSDSIDLVANGMLDIVVAHLGVTLKEPVPEVDPGADDVPAVVLDPSKTISTFGWRPQYNFEQTIKRMLAWYDRHGVTAIYSHLKAPPAKG